MYVTERQISGFVGIEEDLRAKALGQRARRTLVGGGGSTGAPEAVPAACALPPHAARTGELQDPGKDTLPREPGWGSPRQEKGTVREVSRQAGQPLYAWCSLN